MDASHRTQRSIDPSEDVFVENYVCVIYVACMTGPLIYEPSGANAIFRAEHDTSAERETRGRE